MKPPGGLILVQQFHKPTGWFHSRVVLQNPSWGFNLGGLFHKPQEVLFYGCGFVVTLEFHFRGGFTNLSW